MEQLFNNPNGRRGGAIVTIPMHELYELIRARLEYVRIDFDPDALCQNICVEVEKQQGTYPNLSAPVDSMGRTQADRVAIHDKHEASRGQYDPGEPS